MQLITPKLKPSKKDLDKDNMTMDRKVHHIPFQKSIIFTKNIDIKTLKLAVWKPHIMIEWRMIED